MNASRPKKSLSGYRILDLSRILAGPFCTMLLGDQGAEIIKVERPGSGDDTRTWGPPFSGGESAYYICCNRSKKSIVVDLKKPEGVELIKEMVKESDVLVENFTPGFMKKIGLDYGELDVLRDQDNNKIYVVDANSTPFGPPQQMDWKKKEEALHMLARAFEEQFISTLKEEKT